METRWDIQGRHFVFRPYAAGDEAGILELWRKAFGKEMRPGLWAWKYRDCPFAVEIGLCRCEEDGEVVVSFGGIAFRGSLDGKEIRMTHLVDIMSHPLYRKTGLFVHTAEAFFACFAGPSKTSLYYGFPGKIHFDIGQKYLQYRPLPAGVSYWSARTGDIEERKTRSRGRLERIVAADRRIDALWHEREAGYPLSVRRDSVFLTWRFSAHPFNAYEIWGYRTAFRSRLRGYAVLSLGEDGKKAKLLDLLLPPSVEDSADFLRRLGRELSGRGVTQLVCWLPGGHESGKAALAAGFVQGAEPLGIIPTARVFDPALAFSRVCEALYYTMADGDLF